MCPYSALTRIGPPHLVACKSIAKVYTGGLQACLESEWIGDVR